MSGSASANDPNNRFILGEVMVKFKPETEANRLLSQAIRSDPPNLEVLVPTRHLLSEKIGIPLKLKQLLSGGWVLWNADVEKLTKQSAARLRGRHSITNIRFKTGEPKPMSPLPAQEIVLNFRSGSRENKVLQAKLTGSGEDSFTALISELSNTLDTPWLGSVDRQANLILELDLKELTLTMAKRLQGLSETIESVQLNYISTIM